MNLKDQIKVECIKKGYKLTEIAQIIGISRQNLYHHITHKNIKIIKMVETILDLEEGYFI